MEPTNDTTTSTALVATRSPEPMGERVHRMAGAFTRVANAVAGGSHLAPVSPGFTLALAGGEFPSTSEWRQLFYAVLALHPHRDARIALAVSGPLGALRALVLDPDPRVRHAVLDNPFVVDADIQAALAADPDPEIVVGLLQRVSPTPEVCRIVMDGPHIEARRMLARMRIGGDRLKALAHDADLVTRCIARSRLDVRGELGTGVDHG